jgi:hypothetical protein
MKLVSYTLLFLLAFLSFFLQIEWMKYVARKREDILGCYALTKTETTLTKPMLRSLLVA